MLHTYPHDTQLLGYYWRTLHFPFHRSDLRKTTALQRPLGISMTRLALPVPGPVCGAHSCRSSIASLLIIGPLRFFTGSSAGWSRDPGAHARGGGERRGGEERGRLGRQEVRWVAGCVRRRGTRGCGRKHMRPRYVGFPFKGKLHCICSSFRPIQLPSYTNHWDSAPTLWDNKLSLNPTKLNVTMPIILQYFVSHNPEFAF